MLCKNWEQKYQKQLNYSFINFINTMNVRAKGCTTQTIIRPTDRIFNSTQSRDVKHSKTKQNTQKKMNLDHVNVKILGVVVLES